MKILIIGGTGTISGAVSRQLAAEGHDLWLLNRGKREVEIPTGVHRIITDINDEHFVAEKLANQSFDVVCEFIGYLSAQVERDYRLFRNRTRQYVFISSASAYRKPAQDYLITEETPLANPYWQYARDKIACETLLMKHFREDGFPVTIVRPSHTYGECSVPVGVHGMKGSWQVLKRMLEGKPVLIHGDGSSLWTMTWNEDFARGFIGLLGNPRAIGEAFQITSDETLSWNQIYQTIAATLGVPLKPCYVASSFLAAAAPKAYDMEGKLLGDKAVSVVFDCSKLKRAVPGFQTRVPFSEGVSYAIRHILSHPELQTPDPEFDRWCDQVAAAQAAALFRQTGAEQCGL